MNNPLVSVVMVVSNADRFLAESIESILGQTFRDFEFIIVDFGSTDKSIPIISSYAAKDARIRLHKISHCSLPEARNAACSLAQGQYIATMDADDVAEKDRLLKQVNFMNMHPEVGLLGGAEEWIDAGGRTVAVKCVPTEDHEIQAVLKTGCPFRQATVLFRSQAFALVGGYRAAFVQAEDYDLWLRIAEHFRCANLGEVILKYRIHSCQVSMRKRAEQTLCGLGAQASARSRKNGLPDPVNQVTEITSEALVAWGVPLSEQRGAIAYDYLRWVWLMFWAGEYSTALNAALEMSQSDLKLIERWQVADLHLMVAKLLWREGRLLSSLRSAGRAVWTRPLVAGRPLKFILQGLRRVQPPTPVGTEESSISK